MPETESYSYNNYRSQIGRYFYENPVFIPAIYGGDEYGIYFKIQSGHGVRHMQINWNLTSKRALIRSSDIIVFSVAKSGRTWLRVLINKYFSLVYDMPFGLADLSKQESKVPSIFFTHELWEHYSKATLSQKLLGKYIIPDRDIASRKIVLLYRDPRDVLVSLYFHMRKRSQTRTKLDIAEFIHDKRHGIFSIVRVMNQWHNRFAKLPNAFWISYEALKYDAQHQLHTLIKFLTSNNADSKLVREAVSFAEFDSMKKMEAKGAFGTSILKPGDISDPDSFKVRRGVVGGYVEHFSENDLLLLDQAVAKLDPFFGYHIGPA